MIEAVPVTLDLACQLQATIRRTDCCNQPLAIMLCSKYSSIIVRDGVPVVAVGAKEYAPGQFNLWLIATDDLPSVRFTLVKTIRKLLAQHGPDNLKTIRLVPDTHNPVSFQWTDFVRRLCPRPEYSEN